MGYVSSLGGNTWPRCQSSGRTSNSNFTVRESFSTHSELKSCLCDNPKIPQLIRTSRSFLSQMCDPLEESRWFLFPKKDSLHINAHCVWNDTNPYQSQKGKEKGNWIKLKKNTSFWKFEVCFDVEDHHGTDNTINISMWEAASWVQDVSSVLSTWTLQNPQMGGGLDLFLSLPWCRLCCHDAPNLVDIPFGWSKKGGQVTSRTKLAKTQTEMMQKKWVPKPSMKLPKVGDSDKTPNLFS